MDADGAHPKRARLLDERNSDRRVVELEADPVRAPLGVALPGRDRIAPDRLRHQLERPDRGGVGDHHGMQEKAMRPCHLLDQHAHPLGLLERQGIALRQLGHEAQHREVGVAVQEHVLDELLGREAVDRVGVAAGPLREARQDLLPVLAGVGPPLAGGIDHVGLDVEDELVAGKRALGGRQLERRLGRQAEGAAGVAAGGERLVQGHERGRGAAQRLEERAAREADPRRMLGQPLGGERVRPGHRLGQRHRPELAVRGRIDLDRQPVGARADHDLPLPGIRLIVLKLSLGRRRSSRSGAPLPGLQPGLEPVHSLRS